jgi:4-amino-4-deoxy-L-arabinose transferase-like glycosyltransferase
VTPETSPSIAGIEAPPLRVAAMTWGFAGAAACATMAVLEPNLVEEGFPLHVAQRLLAGEHLYRDIVFYTGPLPFELLALLFRIFGESVLVARAVVVALHGITSAATFGLARRAGSGALAHVAAAIVVVSPMLLFPLYSIYFHTTLAMSLTVLAVYAAVRATESIGWACAAGVLAASVALSKQTVGATLGLGLLLTLWRVTSPERRTAAVGGFVVGSAGVALVSLLAFAASGTLGDMVTALVVTPLSLSDAFRMPFPNFWPPGVLDNYTRVNWPYYLPGLYVILAHPPPLPRVLCLATQLLYAAPVAVLVATLGRGVRRRLPAPVWLNGVGLLAASTNLHPRADWGHLALALPATAVQLVLLAAVPVGGRAPRASRALVAASLVAALLSAGATAGAYIHATSGPPTFGPRVPLRPVTDIYRTPAVPRVIDYLRTHTRPGEEIFVARQEPFLYFATETRNPTRYEGILHGLVRQQQEEILSVLPDLRFVVMSELDSPPMGIYSQELPAVYAALERYFRVPDDFPVDAAQWILVLERGPDRGASAVDFVAGRKAGRPWMRDRYGTTRWVDPAVMPVGNSRNLRRPLFTLMGELGGGIDFSFDVPRNAVFQAGLGLGTLVTSLGIIQQDVDMRCFVRVRSAYRQEVLQSVMVPADPSGDRGWQSIEADLSAYAGQRITLRLETVPTAPLPGPARAMATPIRWVWWGSPRIAVRAIGQ